MTDDSLSFDLIHPTPLLVVISGPSGVGKDAVIKAMRKRDSSLHFVVTMTDRAPRPEEVDGVDYSFVTRPDFEQMIADGEFLEHALVYGDHKGIPRKQIREAFASKRDVILRVDVQGAMTMRQLCPQAILIFLIPSNVTEWIDRLMARKTETAKSLELRIKTARQELTYLSQFDYVVINADDRLEEAVETIQAIIAAEHHRVEPREVKL